MAVFSAITAAAHPRVSGENSDFLTNGDMCEGSSPRERGKRSSRERGSWPERLIPA